MKRVLYLGTDPTEFKRKAADCEVTHYPVIRIVPRSVDRPEIRSSYADLDRYTHLIFTSKQGVRLFFDHVKAFNLEMAMITKRYIAVGEVTASYLLRQGIVSPLVATEETQEGIISLLQTLDLTAAYLFIPTSSLSRPALIEFLQQQRILHRVCALYDTINQALEPRPQLEEYDLVVFTSPSTVQAFLSIFGQLPPVEKCYSVGPITAQALKHGLE